MAQEALASLRSIQPHRPTIEAALEKLEHELRDALQAVELHRRLAEGQDATIEGLRAKEALLALSLRQADEALASERATVARLRETFERREAQLSEDAAVVLGGQAQ